MYQEPAGKEPCFYLWGWRTAHQVLQSVWNPGQDHPVVGNAPGQKKKDISSLWGQREGRRICKAHRRVRLPSCGLTGPLSHQLSQALEEVQSCQAAWLSWNVLVPSLVDPSKAGCLRAPRSGMGLWSSGGPRPCLPCC